MKTISFFVVVQNRNIVLQKLMHERGSRHQISECKIWGKSVPSKIFINCSESQQNVPYGDTHNQKSPKRIFFDVETSIGFISPLVMYLNYTCGNSLREKLLKRLLNST